MPKVPRKSKSSIEKSIMATLPWTCTNFGGHSEIEARLGATGSWETLATVHSVDGIDAEDIANFVIQVIKGLRMNSTAVTKANNDDLADI